MQASEDSHAAPSEEVKAWASYGNTAEDEDFIIGSSAGLRELRNHIDAALLNGESTIKDPAIEFNGIRRKDSPAEIPRRSRLSRLAGYGCSLVVLIFVSLSVYALVTLVRTWLQ